MKKLSNFICKHKKIILILTIILLIPSMLGMNMTKINYDILVYLPEDIETLKGENILTDDFKMGSFSIMVVNDMPDKDLIRLEEKFRKIEGVTNVVSINDLTGSTIPIEMLPSEITEKVAKDDTKLVMVTFENSTSDDITLTAVETMREIADDSIKIGGMSAMVLDIKNLFNSEMLLYVVIAVVLCIIVLMISLDSYIVPFLLITNIGVAILFNMGSNIIFGEISYITKAIAAVLQLGVTTDFSIFLYHKYEKAKKQYQNIDEAMSEAICETLTSVLGSSLTTIAGFLALCTMNLTLGMDIGLVMAKGVLLGLICVITLFPALLLTFDKLIEQTRHKEILPHFNGIKNFVIKHYIAIFIIFIILLVPAYLSQTKTPVYYKLDSSIPENYAYSQATKVLKEKYNMVSQEIILTSRDLENYKINEMMNEIQELYGINMIISPTILSQYGISEDMIPEKIKNIYQTDEYQMMIINSSYDIATDELNNQIDEISKIVDKYDDKAIVAGEGALMKDLVTTTDEDFHNVNYTSIIIIFILMMLTLRSISLPVLLVTAIEFAIFINMGIPYFTDTSIPFIASVVIGTIQLGATIDYAILMTTKYLELRKEGKDKTKAVRGALDNSVTSIVVSGMCFFAATFGVGMVSKIDMIGSLCTLLARGAIISMIVVIMIVPSILLIFDKIICKTTLGFRKVDDRMKKLKKACVWLMIMGVCYSSMPVYALTKDETVYAKLNNDGSVDNIKVSDHLINDLDLDNLEDLTNLEEIFNVNGNETFKLENNKLLWDAKGNDIFYQGVSQKEMPIQVQIKYYLDGLELSLDDIIGKSGRVDIKLKYVNNSKKYVIINGKKELLYTPFVVTTAMVIEGKTNSNIEVSNGKVVNNGTNNIVVGMATPGLYDSLNLDFLRDMDEITISFDTTKFELASIYSVITPKVIDSSDLEIFNKMDSLYDDVDTLKSSIDTIEEGAKALLDGTSKVTDGSKQIYENLNVVVSKLEELENGTISVRDGLRQILASLNEAKELLNSQNNSDSISQIEYLISQNHIAIEKLNSTNQTLKDSYDSYHLDSFTTEEIMSFTSETYQEFGLTLSNEEVMNMNVKLVTVKSNYEASYGSNCDLIYLLTSDNQALETTLSTLNSMNEKVNTLINTLEEYLTQIENGASKVSDGTTQMKEGVRLLANKTSELSSGSENLYDGVYALTNGITTFNIDGITKLNDYVNNNVKNVQTKIETLTKLGEEYDTFTMKEEDVDGEVKMILVVDSVKAKEEDKESVVEKEKVGFWEKLKNLFK